MNFPDPILVVAAHPDDETLGCGGTIAKLATTHEIHLLLLTEGRSPVARGQAEQACKHLQAKSISFPSNPLPDQQLERIGVAELADNIATVIRQVQPRTVLTHSMTDLNSDHRLVAEASIIASRPTYLHGRLSSVQSVASYYVPSATEWGFGQFGQFQPNLFIDICSSLDQKLGALKLYTSELGDAYHPRSLKAINAVAAFWGSHVGIAYAEPFQLIWSRT